MTSTNITSIKNLLGNGEMNYDTLFTEGNFQWFKSDEDAYIYVLNTETKRATRYNAEAQNGKRISVDEFESKMADMVVRAAKTKVEESETTEETKEIVKAKKTRKSKDIAYTYSENGETVVTLTAKQVDFVKHLSDTCFWENGLDSQIWVDCLCDEIGGQFAGKPMTVGAMISTLCEKGLGFREKETITDAGTGRSHKATSFGLTELGKTVFNGWGLE